MEQSHKKPVSSEIDIIKNEKLGYNSSIIVSSKELNEVFYYSRDFKTLKDYKLLSIKLNIPFTGNDTTDSRSRILLYLDNEPICDGSIYNSQPWEFKPLNLEGFGFNVKNGNHNLQLKCCVDKGNLHIPHFKEGFIESTIEPKLFGNLIIIGQN